MKTFKSQLKEMSTIYVVKKVVNNIKISGSQDVNNFVREIYPVNLDDRECVLSIYLNNSNRTLGYGICSIGGYTGTLVDIRIVLKEALLLSAVSIVLCHNHPSGTLQPSQSDLTLTKKVKDAAAIMDIRLLDHLILTEDSFYSFADDGKI